MALVNGYSSYCNQNSQYYSSSSSKNKTSSSQSSSAKATQQRAQAYSSYARAQINMQKSITNKGPHQVLQNNNTI